MSKQGRKEAAAAAAAQDLLKLDAARMRKAAAAHSRKDAATPMRKVQGRGRVAQRPEQSSSGLAARVPEQRSRATPPRSFTDSGLFFNGSAVDFFGAAGQSPVGQQWNSQSSDPAMWYSLSILQYTQVQKHDLAVMLEHDFVSLIDSVMDFMFLIWSSILSVNSTHHVVVDSSILC